MSTPPTTKSRESTVRATWNLNNLNPTLHIRYLRRTHPTMSISLNSTFLLLTYFYVLRLQLSPFSNSLEKNKAFRLNKFYKLLAKDQRHMCYIHPSIIAQVLPTRIEKLNPNAKKLNQMPFNKKPSTLLHRSEVPILKTT